jgi:hypothetical protein
MECEEEIEDKENSGPTKPVPFFGPSASNIFNSATTHALKGTSFPTYQKADLRATPWITHV